VLEHLIDVLVNYGQLCRWVAPQLLEMWRVVASVDTVLQHIRPTNVKLRPREDRRHSLDKLLCASPLLGSQFIR